jgi:hypothetical protein
MIKIAIIALLFIIIGCSDRVVIQKVEVPVIVPCIEEIPKEPDYVTNKWKSGLTIWQQVTTLLAERQQRIADQHLLRSVISGCVKSN